MSNASIANYLDLIQDRIARYYLPPIFVLGITGNVANIIMFSRRKLRSNVCSWYFICLSLAQILFLLFSCLYRIITMGWSDDYDLTQTSLGLCKFYIYGFVISLALSRHFLCLISLDRWMKTSRSVWLRQKSSPKCARWVISLSFAFWILFTIHGTIGFQVTSNLLCRASPGSTYQLFFSIYSIIISIVPFAIMIIFGLLVLKNVGRHGQIVNPLHMLPLSNANPQSRAQFKTDFQLVRLSLLQSVIFLIFNAVLSIAPLFNFVTNSQAKNPTQQAINGFINNIGHYLVHTYAALIFGLYTLASSVFRRECKQWLLMIKRDFVRVFYNS